VFGPGTLPKEIVARLNRAINKSLADPEVREKLMQQGLEVESMTSEGFAALVRADVGRWAKIIREAGLRAE
jgi:tripartite-type tricarboxylate transporter receptor subunit TctC